MAKASKYREKITIEELSGTLDAYGNTEQSWSTLTTRMADIREARGKERIQSGALRDGGAATIRIRSDSVTRTITTAMRVTARSQVWDIADIIQLDAENTEIELLVERSIA